MGCNVSTQRDYDHIGIIQSVTNNQYKITLFDERITPIYVDNDIRSSSVKDLRSFTDKIISIRSKSKYHCDSHDLNSIKHHSLSPLEKQYILNNSSEYLKVYVTK